MKYRITKIKKSAIAVLASLTKSDINDSTAILAEKKIRHDPENLKLLEYMEKYGPIPFRWEANFYLRHDPENIERDGLLSDYLLLVDKARGLKRDGYDAFTRREESDKAEKRRERRERWTLRIAFLALIASAFEETIVKFVTIYLLGK